MYRQHVKKIVSIALIALFLFNVIGYYGIYVAMVRQARISLNEKIENNQLNNDQTVTIKIAVSLPYTCGQDVYENVRGDYEHEGELYKLVKQRYSNDTLYVVCTKRQDAKNAFRLMSDFVKVSTDQSSSPNHQTIKTIAGMIKDYNPVVSFLGFAPRNFVELSVPVVSFSGTI